MENILSSQLTLTIKRHKSIEVWTISIGFPLLTTAERLAKRELCKTRALRLIKDDPNMKKTELCDTLRREKYTSISMSKSDKLPTDPAAQERRSKKFKLSIPDEREGMKEHNERHNRKKQWLISIGFPLLTTAERLAKRELCRIRAHELINEDPNIGRTEFYDTLRRENLTLIGKTTCYILDSTKPVRTADSYFCEIEEVVNDTGYKYIKFPLVDQLTWAWIYTIRSQKENNTLGTERAIVYNELEKIINMDEYIVGNVINFENYYNSVIELYPQLDIDGQDFYSCMENRKYNYKSYPTDKTKTNKDENNYGYEDENELEFSKNNFEAYKNNPFRQLVYLMFREYMKVAQLEVDRISLFLIKTYHVSTATKSQLLFKTRLLLYGDGIPYYTEHRDVISHFSITKALRFLLLKAKMIDDVKADISPNLAGSIRLCCLYNNYPSYNSLRRFRSQASRFRIYMVKMGEDANLRTVDDIGYNDMSEKMKHYFNHAVSDIKQDAADYEFDHLFPVSKYFRLVQFGEINDIEMLKNPERSMRLTFQIYKNLCAVPWFFNAAKSNSCIYNIVLEHKDDEIVIKFHCHDGQFRTVSKLIAEYNVDELLKFHDDNPIVSQYWNYRGCDMDLLSSSEKEGKKTHLELMQLSNMVCTNYNSYITQKATSTNEVQLLNRRTRNGKFIQKELLYEVDPMDPIMGDFNDVGDNEIRDSRTERSLSEI